MGVIRLWQLCESEAFYNKTFAQPPFGLSRTTLAILPTYAQIVAVNVLQICIGILKC